MAKQMPDDAVTIELKRLLREGRRASGANDAAKAGSLFAHGKELATGNGRPGDAAVFQASILIADKKYDEAIHLLEPLVKSEFAMLGHAWDRLGVAYAGKKDFDKAIECYQKALAEKSYDTPGYAWFNMGVAYAGRKDFDRAIECYQKALAEKSYDTPGYAWNNLGIAYAGKKDSDKAIECYQKALAEKSYDTPGDAWNNMGVAYAGRKDFDKAIECYQKALAEKSYDTPGYAWNNMGLAYADKKDFDKAIECYRKALDEKSYDKPGDAWFNMGVACADKKDLDKAIDCCEKAARAYRDAGDSAAAAGAHGLEQLWRLTARAKQDGLSNVADEYTSAAAALEATAKAGATPSAPYRRRLIKRASAETTAFLNYASLQGSKLDDALVVLKGWSSSTPVIGEADSEVFGGHQCRGGGYFIKAGGKGIVLDPGYDYLWNFRAEGFHVREVAAVIVTHNHPDHQDDLCRVAQLDLDNRSNTPDAPAKSTIKYLLDPDTERAYVASLTGLSADRNSINQVVVANPDWTVTEGVSLHAFKTTHGDGEIVTAPFGAKFTLRLSDGSKRDVGYTSDSKYTDELSRELKDCDVIVCHFSSARAAEFDDGEKLHDKHLGFNGLRKLIDNTRARLYVVSEFWGGVGDQRHDLVEYLKCEQADKGRKVAIVAGDIGLTIDLRTLGIFCSACGHSRPYDDTRTIEPSDPYDGLRYFCIDCPCAAPGATSRRPRPTRD